jgi:hypothetical protein
MKVTETVLFATGILACWTGGIASLAFAGPKPAAAKAAPALEAAKPNLFETRVRPLLAGKCFSCHSGKVAMAGLRLDSRQAILKGGQHGPALVPGDPAKSPLLQAVRYEGKLKMPPAGKLPDEEITALTRWVKQGAPWVQGPKSTVQSPGPKVQGPNSRVVRSADAGPGTRDAGLRLWAFEPIRKPALPGVKNRGWVRTPVDAFVLAELEKRGLKPSPYADRRTLIRRVSFDLTGLPPTAEEVEAFVSDRSPNAWEKVVDRLLASPHYGERMAGYWLDLARYADSDGYHDDTTRLMWRYRDYVIQSFNRNKPFDQFTVEQLAGDLLPGATIEQKTASAFNRCGPTTSEGGAIPEEVLTTYAVDRVNTAVNVWMGLTIQCAQCHDHKYDPLSMREYYQLVAFFNQVPEEALYRGTDAPPTLLIPTPEQQAKLDDLAKQVSALEAEAKPRADAADAKAETARVEEVNKKLSEVRKQRTEIERAARLRIMADVPQRRPTHLLLRGDYRNRGDEVQPAVPAALGALSKEMKPDRIALAKWIVDPSNPLTARVTVNRFWQMVFGTGLVKSSDDLGTRGERPSHPELLDWLAGRFAGVPGWDVKGLLRLIVTSAAYQQSSRMTPELRQRDPENRLLARGPRFRLPAEMIRDNALAVSGLLDRARPVGGPSVKPYQPGDLWRELSAGDDATKSYVQDHGPDLYRRGLYTFWKRSILYPSFAVFDAPKREVCTARRPITNTPLQAFATLNDTAFVEAARVFAQRIMQKGGSDPGSRLAYACTAALSRPPGPRERQVLLRIYQNTLENYRQHPEDAVKLVSAGEAPRPPELDPSELAAWTCVCNALLNLDEAITKE